MTWLVIFVPVTIGLEVFAPEHYLLIFITSSLAILPLARWMGDATEQLAAYFGEGVGGLLNATFGNAAELIIAFAALRAGLYDVSRRRLWAPSHPDHQRPVAPTQTRTARCLPSCNIELMPEKEVLGFKPTPRLEPVGDKRPKQGKDRKHQVG